MPRHEIPTHLNVEDRVLLGLTLRQALYLLGGLASAYGAWAQWPELPVGARAALAAGCLFLAAAVALCRPGRRGLDEWAVAAARYATVPKTAVWRPGAGAAPSGTVRTRRDLWQDLPATTELLWPPDASPTDATIAATGVRR